MFVESFSEGAPGNVSVTLPSGAKAPVWKALTVVAQIWDTRTEKVVWDRLCQSASTILDAPAPEDMFVSFLVTELVASLP